MMIYQDVMILEKGEESTSYEFWQELELNMLMMLMMKLVTSLVMELPMLMEKVMLMKKVVVILIWNFTNKWNVNMLQGLLQNLPSTPGIIT